MSVRRPKAKQDSQFAQRIAVFKTVLPLGITLLCLGLVYFFILVPKSAESKLRTAVLNTLDSSKQQSYRFDGEYIDSNRHIDIDYSGQKSANSDTQLTIRLKWKDSVTTIDSVTIDSEQYLRISGATNLNSILSEATGIRTLSDLEASILAALDNRWLSASGITLGPVTGGNCSIELDSLIGLGRDLTPQNYPLELLQGPLIDPDDENLKVYEAKLNVAMAKAVQLDDPLSCLESSLAVDEPGLRDATTADLALVRLIVTVDPLSETIRSLESRTVGVTSRLHIRDYNKDISISSPIDSLGLPQVLELLNDTQKTYIVTRIQSQ